ncbi:MAG: carboxypeptidase-like regulatory domain-containing protein, partial [Flammeovirgaceae bacterium]
MKIKNLFVTLCLMLISITSWSQSTTSSINGTITDDKNEQLFGAKVYATHTPTGSSFGSLTNDKGFFVINNMAAGGPYTIKITYGGFKDTALTDIYLVLGED